MEGPGSATQTKMLALAKDFVARTIPRLPNFTATRTTTTYQRDLLYKELWHAVGLSHALVFYRDGQETQSSSEFEIDPVLSTRGEFGPILSAVTLDITKDNFAWSRWEHGEKGPLAVFQYRAEAGHSHYEVENRLSGYVGEITIDPADGSIVRLALKADMEPANPFLMADVMIEYGPEVLGDKDLYLPEKGRGTIAGSEATVGEQRGIHQLPPVPRNHAHPAWSETNGMKGALHAPGQIVVARQTSVDDDPT